MTRPWSATHISIKLLPDQGLIKGKVTSKKEACVKNRDVFLNFLGEETPLNPPEFANGKGHHIIHSDSPPLPEGTYLTHVKKVKFGGDKVCKPAKSEVASNPASQPPTTNVQAGGCTSQGLTARADESGAHPKAAGYPA